MKSRLFHESELVIQGHRARVRNDHGRMKSGGVSRSTVPTASLPYRSKWELRFSQQLEMEYRTGLIKGWLYEPFSFKLANGKRYRVDFVTWGEEGTVCYEVKGHHRNKRDSLTHLAWAAQRFPFFLWKKVWWTGRAFDGQWIVT